MYITLQTVKRKQSILKLARTGENSLAIKGDEWDKKPMSLCVLNGVIDLETGELKPGNPEDYLKTVAPTNYYGLDYRASIWERFLLDVFDGDEDIVAYIQRLFGYGITGLNNEHTIPFFYGPRGRNGKSTILETMKFVLGSYAYKTRSEILLESRYAPARGAADADTLALCGKRIVWATESGDGRSLAAAKVKELCGGDTLNARAPYGKRPVEFSPSHLLIFLTNYKPTVPANDDALWARIDLVTFNMRFVNNPCGPDERQADHNLLEKLKAEAPGILAWLVRGCLQWRDIGLNPPSSVKMATANYRSDEDDIAQFLQETFIRQVDGSEKMGNIYKSYVDWHELSGLSGRHLSLKKFSHRLVSLGFVRDDSGRNVMIKGIRSRND